VRLSSVSATDSFAVWMMRHGRHVRTLKWAADDKAAVNQPVDIFASALARCLKVVGLASPLADLAISIQSDGGLHLRTDCLRTLHSLPRLRLVAESTANISKALSGLTALQSLEVRGPVLHLPVDTRLPPTITRLWVGGDYYDEVPLQVSRALGLGMQVDVCVADQAAGMHPTIVHPAKVLPHPCLRAVGSVAAAAAAQAGRMQVLSRQPVPAVGPQRQPDTAGCFKLPAVRCGPSGAHTPAAPGVSLNAG